MRKEKLGELYKKYELTEDDYFKSPQGWVIITRSGIDAIQSKANIKINYKEVVIEREFAVVKAMAENGANYIETYGEADKKTNCKNSYPIAMAEKRAMSRAVLKLTGFYELGVFGEDEADNFKRPTKEEKKTVDWSKVNRIESLLGHSNLDHDERAGIEREFVDMTEERAVQLIEYLEQNQLDPIKSGFNYSQTDIK